MQRTSEQYQRLLRSGHSKETRLVIAGTEYTGADIVAVSTTGGLYESAGIGNAAAKQIDFTVIPKGSIPKQARVEVYVRLTDGAEHSEWIPQGVFFFATREKDPATGALRVHGFDAMLKTEAVWLDNSYAAESWPMNPRHAAEDIAARIGVELDERTALDPAWPVHYPVDGEGDLTMREVLRRLAVANGGNWEISDAGRLRLVPLVSAPEDTANLVTEHGDAVTFGGIRLLIGSAAVGKYAAEGGKVFVGQRAADFRPGFNNQAISRVELLNENGDIVGEAGSDTGRTLTATHPDGSSAMAADILEKVAGFVYRPFDAEDALLDPAAELGDGVTVAGVYSVLAQKSATLDSLHTTDASAPTTDEIEDEFPYVSRTERQIRRNYAATRSLITKTAEEIRLEVQGVSSEVSALSVKLGSITLSVSNGSTSSTIKLMAGSTLISSQTITMDGLVTFTGLANGTTVINGGCIQTGSIAAKYLNLTGAITFRDLSGAMQEDFEYAYETADEAWDMAYDAQQLASGVDEVVAGWTYRGTTYIDGQKLMTGTVMASSLQGGEVLLLAANGTVSGYLDILPASSSGYQIALASDGAISVRADGGDAFIESRYGYVTLSAGDAVTVQSDFYPSSDDRYDLGSSNFVWANLYVGSGEINTSDREEKEEIDYDMGKYSEFFDRLQPVSFKMRHGTSGRRHVGFISQDVEDALTGAALTSRDFAGFIKSPVEENGQAVEGKYRYGLRYTEFTALNTWEIQRLKEEIRQLKNQLEEMRVPE